jgi:hypothetical protein
MGGGLVTGRQDLPLVVVVSAAAIVVVIARAVNPDPEADAGKTRCTDPATRNYLPLTKGEKKVKIYVCRIFTNLSARPGKMLQGWYPCGSWAGGMIP